MHRLDIIDISFVTRPRLLTLKFTSFKKYEILINRLNVRNKKKKDFSELNKVVKLFHNVGLVKFHPMNRHQKVLLFVL